MNIPFDEGLGQHSIARHSWIYNEQIYVPLIVRIPGGPTGRVPKLASLIDLLPILAEEAHLPLDASQFDGINVLRKAGKSALSQREVAKRFPESAVTLTGLDWKLWQIDGAPDKLFDLAADPHELVNQLDRHPQRAESMHADIQTLVTENRAVSRLKQKGEIQEQNRSQMEALGYTE